MEKEEIKEVEKQEAEKVDKEAPEAAKPEEKEQPKEAPKTYTQEEVDAMVGKAKHKEKEKQKVAPQQVEEEEEGQAQPQTPTPQLDARPYQIQVAQAEIKVALATQGIDPTKLHRVARLIDAEAILTETGEIAQDTLNAEIEKLLSEWPELKGPSASSATFVIGSTKEANSNPINDDISRAFGNKK